MRALFIAAAGFISSLVLVFAFALGARVTKDIRSDTIAKWTGNLWINVDSEFKFDEKKNRFIREGNPGSPGIPQSASCGIGRRSLGDELLRNAGRHSPHLRADTGNRFQNR